jgi:dUTP pyrophosphatase
MLLKYAKIYASAHDPVRAYNSDACWDLAAHGDHMVGRWNTIPTGLKFDIPHGYCGLIMSRSGLAAKDGVFVLNAPGVIDAGYAGEIQVVLGNLSDNIWEIQDGERIAQLFIAPVEQHYLLRDDTIEIFSMRGEGGFGSTGY